MVMNIIAGALIVGITFVNSIFGLFSGLINLFCTIFAACVALGFWEPIAGWMAKDIGLPAIAPYAGPVAIVLLFALTLTLLRVLADNYVRGNVHVPVYVDWGGAAVCGLLSAMISVGILVIGVRMLPLGSEPLGYASFERTEEKQDNLAVYRAGGVLLNPDGFTANLVSYLSGGSLRGTTPMSEVYPDFAEWIRWSGNTVQSESSPAPLRDKGDGFTAGIEVQQWWEQKEALKARYRELQPTKDQPTPPFSSDRDYRPAAGARLIGARVVLKNASADRVKGGGLHLFRPSMIRVVGTVGDDPQHYFPRVLGGIDELLVAARRIVDPDNNFSIVADGDKPIDVFFEVDQEFKPRFLEYRRHARAVMPAVAVAKAPAPAAFTAKGTGPGGAGDRQASGALSFIDSVSGSGSGDNDQLPRDLSIATLRRNLDVKITGELFESGRISGELERINAESGDTVKKFKVPEGFRLCQIRYRPRQALTTAGQVFNYVARTVNQYNVKDNAGEDHPLVGYYAVVKRNGKDFIELFYTGQRNDPAFRSMLDFKEISAAELTASDESELGLLFLVPPSRTVTTVFSQGGQVDLGQGFPMAGG